MIYANGDRYEGFWKDGKRDRKGMLIVANKDKYEQQWKNGIKLGEDSPVSDKSKYTGQMKDDLKHGEGTMIYPNGDKYVGKWEDGFKNGEGLCITLMVTSMTAGGSSLTSLVLE